MKSSNPTKTFLPCFKKCSATEQATYGAKYCCPGGEEAPDPRGDQDGRAGCGGAPQGFPKAPAQVQAPDRHQRRHGPGSPDPPGRGVPGPGAQGREEAPDAPGAGALA